MTDKTEEKLTPTEELVAEVLIARYRLGEPCWTFSRASSRPAIRSLAEKGYVTYKEGTSADSKATLVWLTDKGKVEWLTYKYVAPITRGTKAEKKSKAVYKAAKALKKRSGK